jgi:hypothetical protein
VAYLILVLLSIFFVHKIEREIFPAIMLGFCLGMLLSGVLAFYISIFTIREPYVLQTNYIHSISYRDRIEGAFFLGTGSIKGVDYYYFVRDTRFGNKIDRVPIRHAYIVETEGQPYMEIRTTIPKSNFMRTMFPNRGYDHYVFYVPPGTIIQSYRIEL